MEFRERFKDAALDVGLGRKYGHTGDDSQNCVRFLYAILLVIYGELVKSKLAELHLNIANGLGSFANCAALVSLQIGEWATTPSTPGIYYCQGWRKINGELKGHSFALVVYPTPLTGEWLWILESTNGTSDWYRPVKWSDLVDKWSAGLKLVRLLEP